MALLPVGNHRWQIKAELPDVPDRVLEAAWDPTATVLLSMDIYIGVVRGCCGTEDDLSSVLDLYFAAHLLQDQRHIPESRAMTTSTASGVVEDSDRLPVPRHPDTLMEQPTVPRIRLPLAAAVSAPRIPPELRTITTQAAFVDYLKQLVTRSGYALRKIEQKTKEHFPDAPVLKSTLHDALQRTTVPTNEASLRSVLTVLYMRITDRDHADPNVARRVEEALDVWRRVQLPPPTDTPLLIAGAGACSPGSPTCYPLLDAVLKALDRAEKTARRIGSADAPGLAHAQRIVRELAT
ncbi:hypothetical protein ACIRSS_23525 [Amycolatopsis sp. NPDC101161]|uniref:hypothetical protein n=1 Tax=Amycolatopsis sp. NPDC101161 TaxID=3363940 RepID=UPI00382E695C